MKENESQAEKKPVKTYISENNQNKISSTITLADGHVSRETPVAANSQETLASAENNTETGQVPGSSSSPEEPELLNAPTLAVDTPEGNTTTVPASPWPPTMAIADAEAAAGLPIGSLAGHQEAGADNQQ
jgi:hypothetical protein